jgi:hypothetical protein
VLHPLIEIQKGGANLILAETLAVALSKKKEEHNWVYWVRQHMPCHRI